MLMNDLTATARRLKKLLALSCEADRQLTVWYYASAAIGAIAPVGTSVAIKYLIDAFLAPTAGWNLHSRGLSPWSWPRGFSCSAPTHL